MGQNLHKTGGALAKGALPVLYYMYHFMKRRSEMERKMPPPPQKEEGSAFDYTPEHLG